MSEQSLWFIAGALAALHISNLLWRRHRAREIARRWLQQHNYRVRTLSSVFWSDQPRFRSTWFRNSDYAVDFRAEVDDMRLGGTGDVHIRVWTDWLGMIGRDPEISWARMPTLDNGGSLTPEMHWEHAQVSVLRRVAGGETTLRPSGRDPAARGEFDELVEHILALQRRGLLHCATPIAELRSAAQYAEVADVVLTDEGRRAIQRANASHPTAGAS